MSWLVLMLPLGYALLLTWQEWQFRQGLMLASQAPSVARVPHREPAPLNILAVATVLGLTAQSSVLISPEPLTLRATVVASDSASRALLAGTDGERFYRAGERLPGGSLLRRIEPAHVVLWRQGREELLLLRPAGERFLRTAHTPRQPATYHLRPTVEQSRNE